MKKFTILILLVSALLSCQSDNIEHKIDKIFDEFSWAAGPGVSLAVLKNESLIYQKGFGLADLESKVEIEPKTNFRLASITKQFTSFSVLLLEQEGKLTINDFITDYIPELPSYAKRITIKNLLQHTSGFLDYEDFIDEKMTDQLKDKDVLDILLKQDSTYFIPGNKHRYSNSGYAVLAILIERVSDITFSEFLQKNIFEPLNMTNSVAFVDGINIVPNRSFGYAKSDSGFEFSDQSLSSAVLGDGGIYSSTIDLIKWDKEMRNPALLNKNKIKEIFENGVNSKGEKFDYGLGWRLDPYKNYSRRYHTGSTCGFSNIYMSLPEQNLTIIVLINIRDYDAKEYAERIADLFLE